MQGFFLVSQGKRAVFFLPAGVARLGGFCIFSLPKRKRKKLRFFCKKNLTFNNYCEKRRGKKAKTGGLYGKKGIGKGAVLLIVPLCNWVPGLAWLGLEKAFLLKLWALQFFL